MGGKKLRQITAAEVAQHTTQGDCWLIIDDNVYDVTKFIDQHPGGHRVLVDVGGQDATDEFYDVEHSNVAHDRMEAFLIGELAGRQALPPAADAAAAASVAQRKNVTQLPGTQPRPTAAGVQRASREQQTNQSVQVEVSREFKYGSIVLLLLFAWMYWSAE
jgi:hypothetical protein